MPNAVDETQLQDLIKKSPLLFIDFWAKWCAPCKVFSEIYHAVAAENPDICFTKVDIEAHPELAKVFDLQSIPHLIVFKGGHIIFSESGSMPKTRLEELCVQAREIPENLSVMDNL